MTPSSNSLSTRSIANASSINLCTNEDILVAAAVAPRSDSSSDHGDEPTYITSLIYNEDQQIPFFDISDLFSYPDQVTFKNVDKIVASRSMPIFLDQGNYIEALTYTSNEAINAELPTSELGLAENNLETRSDGYLNVSSQQQVLQTAGDMEREHSHAVVNYHFDSEGYLLNI